MIILRISINVTIKLWQWYTLVIKASNVKIIRDDSLCLQENIPFAVVGTDQEHQVNGNKVLGRKTKWGIIEGNPLFYLHICRMRDWIYPQKYLSIKIIYFKLN